MWNWVPIGQWELNCNRFVFNSHKRVQHKRSSICTDRVPSSWVLAVLAVGYRGNRGQMQCRLVKERPWWRSRMRSKTHSVVRSIKYSKSGQNNKKLCLFVFWWNRKKSYLSTITYEMSIISCCQSSFPPHKLIVCGEVQNFTELYFSRSRWCNSPERRLQFFFFF